MPQLKTPNTLFAVLKNDTVCKISLLQNIVPDIRKVFVDAGNVVYNDQTELVLFDGNYVVEEGQILYVEYVLPDSLKAAIANPIGLPQLNLNDNQVKCLVWVENPGKKDQTVYFQNFDKRRLLKNKTVLFADKNTYGAFKENAFVIEESVSAIHDNGKLLFVSYTNANKVYSLSDFYAAATNKDIEDFSKHKKISLDVQWFQDNTNSVIRKQITLIRNSKILDGADLNKIKKDAANFDLVIDVTKGKIVFPNDTKHCKDVLCYLNEQYYTGPISGTKFRANSKQKVLAK